MLLNEATYCVISIHQETKIVLSFEKLTYSLNFRVFVALFPIRISSQFYQHKRHSNVVEAMLSIVNKFRFQISVFASFWLINDTGIPLIFKQDGNAQEMAGQFDEHEMARSLTPLLFSFDDRDGSFR